jgi:penicillin-binding protein 1A
MLFDYRTSTNKKKRTLLVRLGLIWLGLLVFMLGAATGFLYIELRDLPGIEQLEGFVPPVVTSVYSDTDQIFAEYYQQKRILIPLSDIPQNFINALIAVEDLDFYKHWGIDFRGIFRALWKDIRAGKIVEGGSTLTQQLAKVLFLSPEKSISRKLKEVLLALQIEKKYTKSEILELYCNQIYLGKGVYGLEAVSRAYFSKPARELDLAEAALLAGLPKSPNRYSPFTNPELALKRRNHVLQRMINAGFISPGEGEQAMARPIQLNPSDNIEGLGAYFSETIRQYVEEKYGFNTLYRQGLNIYTSLNIQLQQAAEAAVSNGIKNLVNRQAYPNDDYPQAALVAIDPQNGYIKALVGGTNFSVSQFNRVIQAKRQAGSAFKPIVYATAIEAGYTPTHIIDDSPLRIPDPIAGQDWEPANFEGEFYGPTTLRQGLERSRNVVTVKLMLELGPESVINMARRLGITSPLKPYPSLALGAFEVSPLELTNAYAVLANGGVKYEPELIRYITDKQGKLLEEQIPYPKTILSRETAYIVTHMLQGVVTRGTGWRAKALGIPVAAKTGTTDDYTDAWFVGYVPSLVSGVWVGYDQKRTLGEEETGSRAASPIWIDFMQQGLHNKPVKNFTPPEGVILVNIDANSGLLATAGCPDVIEEAFRTGTEPSLPCDLHHEQKEMSND